jgi:hypothetical protein
MEVGEEEEVSKVKGKSGFSLRRRASNERAKNGPAISQALGLGVVFNNLHAS